MMIIVGGKHSSNTNKLYEILPNYLYRNGVDVIWRTSNWGNPPIHIEKYHRKQELREQYPEITGG